MDLLKCSKMLIVANIQRPYLIEQLLKIHSNVLRRVKPRY